LPAFHAVFAAFTARRVERALPGYLVFTSLSWTTSPRIVAFDCSTHSSIFSRNASIIFGRGSRSYGCGRCRGPLDRLRVVPRQGGRRPDRLGQVVRLKYFRDLSVSLFFMV
jgi:hypothetical protein